MTPYAAWPRRGHRRKRSAWLRSPPRSSAPTPRHRPPRRAPADAELPGSPRMSEFFFVIVPYLCLATFVVGHLWRYRYDKFGWTTRSSQLYENRLLRIGSPLFHFGMLGVVGGHVIGLLVPQSWTDAVGISHTTYHVVAVAGGLLAGMMTVVGHRDPHLPPPYRRTRLLRDHAHGQGDVCLPVVVIVLGMWNTDRRLDPDDRRRVQLPRRRIGLVPLVPRLPPGRRPDGGGSLGSSCTRSSPSGSSRCGRSPGWCTCSAPRSAT